MKNRTKHLHPCLLQNYQKIQHVTNSHYVLNHSSFILNFVLYNYFDLYGAYSCIRRHTHPFLECLESMSPFSLCAPLTFCRKTTPLYFQMFLAQSPLWVLSKASKVATFPKKRCLCFMGRQKLYPWMMFYLDGSTGRLNLWQRFLKTFILHTCF